MQAMAAGGVASAALNAANEIAVDAFLERRIGFMDIARTVDAVLGGLSNRTPSGLDDVLSADADARRAARDFIAGGRVLVAPAATRTGTVDRAVQ
jgi:1-deoxy-D-xylulose-5-phosphate reductoisomerase